MQDAHVNPWERESFVSQETLESLRELNLGFLDWVVAQSVGWKPPRPSELQDVSGQVAPLSPAQKKAAADCPYALFDLRFHDDEHWRARLSAASPWNVADEGAVPRGTRDFVRLALFFAWHVASTAPLAARLLLGMREATATAFREITIDRLPALAATEGENLTARWNDCPRFWHALTEAALRPNLAGLRRIQLYGLQLTAAAHLS